MANDYVGTIKIYDRDGNEVASIPFEAFEKVTYPLSSYIKDAITECS